MQIDQIVRLRFIDRDKAFTQTLTSTKNEMNARGMLLSGECVRRGHDALVKELAESRKTILSTIAEDLDLSRPSKVDKRLTDNALDCLQARRIVLEGTYLEQMQVVFSSLQNREAIKPYTNLSAEMELSEQELRREVAQEIQRYLDSRGATLYARVKNRFLDRPLVVIAMLTVVAVVAILSFLASVRTI